MATEESNSNFSNILWTLLGALAGYVILIEIILPMFRRTGGCGCANNKSSDEFVDESKMNPEMKACVAVGLCNTMTLDGKYISQRQLSKWKNQIMDNADKIFEKIKPKSEAGKVINKKPSRKK